MRGHKPTLATILNAETAARPVATHLFKRETSVQALMCGLITCVGGALISTNPSQLRDYCEADGADKPNQSKMPHLTKTQEMRFLRCRSDRRTRGSAPPKATRTNAVTGRIEHHGRPKEAALDTVAGEGLKAEALPVVAVDVAALNRIGAIGSPPGVEGAAIDLSPPRLASLGASFISSGVEGAD